MKNKYIICLLLIMIFIIGCVKSEEIKEVSIMELDNYKKISVDKIKSVDVIRFTEGGREEEKIVDYDQINSIYNLLKNTKIGKEITRACDDNTKIYVFNMNDGDSINIEIECDWLVMNNKRYEIVK